jgi:hypothetical protein
MGATAEAILANYEKAKWPYLSPRFRETHNRLREARGLPPIPAPAVDKYVSPPLPRLIEPSYGPDSPEVLALKHEFERIALDEQEEVRLWQRIACRLALQNARQALDTPNTLREKEWALWKARLEQIKPAPRRPGKKHIWELIGQRAVETEQRRWQTRQPAKNTRKLRSEVLYHAIAKFVATAKKEAKYSSDHHNPQFRSRRWPMKKIVQEAMRIFEVDRGTVFNAIKHYQEDRHFTYEKPRRRK